MWKWIVVLLALCSGADAAAQRKSLGIWFDWGAFAEPARCFAMAAPQNRRSDFGQRLTIAYDARARAKGQFHARLSRERRSGSAVILRIDDRVFPLVAGPRDVWAPNSRADADIVAAMRRGLQLSIETRSTRGARLRDRYGLRGAATAIDAAALACSR
jgi:hypothetical protein